MALEKWKSSAERNVMKLKIVEFLLEKFLGTTKLSEREGDMFLPERMLSIALTFLLLGIGCGVALFFVQNYYLIVFCPSGLVMGVISILCWKNQRIEVLSDEVFRYTTFLGKSYEYRFSDITMLRRNRDSMTLFLGENKVHIESMAILSDRLVDLINKALAEKYPTE